ncbi:FtsK/SpoIIIE family DNA translocase [Rariglobus hedericola]|uniref:DNA translocase FtsK n=1 Tax=Rariglobus hedericola TaxID=2597822 RepID=A0A556QK03_9BACT|nr:DNA translocase FtsK [Rariglobus hedericola]TSJ76983.1 DNA translocase FtsK [Rariglobus hedericola]
MPKPASSTVNTVPSFQPPRTRPRWIAASSCLLIGLLVTVAFLDFDPEQSRQTGTNFRQAAPNLVGSVGAEFTWWSIHTIGVSIWLLPPFLFWMTYLALRNAKQFAATRVIAMVICVVSASALASMVTSFGKTQYFTEGLGGLLGDLVYTGLFRDTLGVFGTVLLLGTTYILGFVFILVRDIGTEFDKLIHAFHAWRERRAAVRAEAADLRAQLKASADKRKIEAKTAAPAASIVAAPPPNKKLTLPRTGNTASPFAPKTDDESKPAAIVAAVDTPPPVAPVAPRINRGPAKPEGTLESLPAGLGPVSIVKPEETKKAKAPAVPLIEENYEFPSLSLLKEQSAASADGTDEEYAKNMADLVRILGEFGVTVTPGEIHVGPVITCYEVAPAPGVRVEKIAGLDKNIALGMRAQSVRILAPIPGKAAVGVEIPNRVPTPVGMREILESEDWSSAKAEIPIALGKDVSGKPLISDLAKMPHLLIAGATGSGKSVCINSIIASIVYRKSPKDLRLIMVDPKVVELKVFNTLPHMLIPVVTEPKKVPAALKWLLGEMEQRYQIFAKVGVRNIAGFNTRKKSGAADFPSADAQQSLDGVDPLAADDGLDIPEKLPYIVAIIDELADLMMVAPAEIETSIARLAQLARAAGIHLIIATQRPSVNVITGVIKANLPSRIAFQVASQIDSRTILDGKGAETLIGRGDMLFSPPGSSRLVRAQGAFVSDEEVQDFVEFLKKNGPPQYASSVQQQIDRDAAGEEESSESGDSDMGDDEELFNQALDVIKSTKRASTSMIQRRLRIGYNRAARIMDLMEDKGIVGPENGSSPREILKDLDSI